MLDISWELISQIETSYLNYIATKGSNKWLEKQRLLIADMALHLLKTPISPGEIKLDRLRDNLHAILTVTDDFLPNDGPKNALELDPNSGSTQKMIFKLENIK